MAIFSLIFTSSFPIGLKTAEAANTVPKLLNYQARITNSSGVPVPDGNLNIWISVYDASSGGTCLYAMRGSCGTPSFKTVSVVNGVFSTLIGDTVGGDNAISDTLFDASTLYLGITVASDTEMVPRKRLTTAPYAMNADRLDGLDVTSSGSTTPYIPSTTGNGNLVITGDPQGTAVSSGALYVNPAGSTGGETLFGIADNGSARWMIDKEGDVTHVGSLLATAASSTSQFVYNGASGQIGNILDVRTTSGARALGVSATSTQIWGGKPITLDSENGVIGINSRDPNFDDWSGSAALWIQGRNSDRTGLGMYSTGPSGFNPAVINFFNSRGTPEAPLAVANNDRLAAITFAGIDSLGDMIYSSSIRTEVDGAVSAGSLPARITFRTSHVNGSEERMRIDSLGRVAIGTILPTSARLVVAASNSSPTSNIFEVQNTTNLSGDWSAKYLTVSSTGTTVTNLTITGTCTGCSGAAATLQTAYDSSTGTEIFLGPAHGALTIADSFGSFGGNLFEIQNRVNGTGDYSARYFTVSATATIIGSASNTYATSFANSRIGSNLTPTTDAAFDLGDHDRRWRDLWLSGSSLHIGSSQTDEGIIRYDTTGNVFRFDTDAVTDGDLSLMGDLFYIDKSTGYVGIGTAATQVPFTVDAYADTGLAYSFPSMGGNQVATFAKRNSNAAISILSDDFQSSLIWFGQDTNAFEGSIEFNNDPAGNYMELDITGSVGYDMQINTNGIDITNNLLVSGTGGLTVGSGLFVNSNAVPTGSDPRLQVDGSGVFDIFRVNNTAGNKVFTVSSTGTTISTDLVITGNCTGCGGSLQSAYDSATGTAEVYLTASRGAFTLADSFASYGGNLFEIQNRSNATGDYSARYLTVSSTSTIFGVNSDRTGLSGYRVAVGSATTTAQFTVAGDLPSAASGSVSTIASPIDVDVEDNLAYVVGGADSTSAFIQVIDISNPASPTVIGSLNGLGTIPTYVEVVGKYAYVTGTTTSHQFKVIDVSIPTSMKIVGTFGVGASGGFNNVVVNGRYAYAFCDCDTDVYAIDISDPTSPTGTVSINRTFSGSDIVAADRGWLFSAGILNNIHSYDINHDVLSSSQANVSTGVSAPAAIAAQSGYLYVVDSTVLNIYDVRNPKSMSRVGTHNIFGTGGSPADKDLAVQGRYAYIANKGRDVLQVVDISNPAAPFTVGTVAAGAGTTGLDVNGRTAVVVNNTAGTLQTFDIGGAYLQQLESGSVNTGKLTVRSLLEAERAMFYGGMTVNNYLNVGGGISVDSATTSTTSFPLLTLNANRQTGGTYNSSMLHIRMQGAGSGSFSGNGIYIQSNFSSLAGNARAISVGELGTDRFVVSATGTTTIGGDFYFPSSGTLDWWLARPEVDGGIMNIRVPRNNGTQGTCASGQNEGIKFLMGNGTQVGRLACISNATTALQMYASAFNAASTDLAEMYSTDLADDLVAGDVVRLDESEGDLLVRRTAGAYAEDVVGIVSDAPGIAMTGVSEATGQGDTVNGRFVAMAGRVPTKVSVENGPIAIGDYLVPSSVPGVAMRMTKPGVAIGRALDAWNGPGQGSIRVFVQVGFHSGLAITTDGVKSLFNDDFAFLPPAYADEEIQAVASRELSFIGSAWDSGSSTSVTRSITQGLTVTDTSNYQLSFRNNEGNLLAALNQAGDLSIAGSLTVEGGFDYAEMFPAVPDIEAGDIVMIDPENTNGYGVKKTTSAYENSAIGVISTKPGFLTGKNEENSQPVALAGRVPVKVTMEGGEILPGDPITSSSTPGVGMKATEAGRVIGLALQGMAEDGTVLIFVNPSWWNGPMPIGGATAGGSLTIEENSILDFKNSVLTNVAAIISTSGSWSITADGILAAAKVETKTVQTEDIILVQSEEKASTSEGVVPAGYTATVVQNPSMKPNSKVFLSFLGDPRGGYWVAEKGEGNFTIHLSTPALEDLKFEYWIMGVDDRRPTVEEAPEEAPEPAPAPPAESASGTDETGSASGTEETGA